MRADKRERTETVFERVVMDGFLEEDEMRSAAAEVETYAVCSGGRVAL